MCRSIKTLANFEPPTTTAEIEAASLQYVRKVAGMRKPSRANTAAFDQAVAAVSLATQQLLSDLCFRSPPRDREIEAQKQRRRFESQQRLPRS